MKQYDAIIIGAGPAGLCAAQEIAKKGARTAVVDANSQPGGQLIKQIHKFFGSADVCAGVRGIHLGRQLYETTAELGCDFFLDHAAYAIEPMPLGGYCVYCANGETTACISATIVVLALGASENALAFPGWTLPGVITAGAAQTLVNLHRVPCGKRVLMVGAGNVGLIVSYQLLQAGIDVAAVIEAAPQVGGYDVHANKIRRMGVPVLTSHTILEARGEESVSSALIAQVDDSFAPIPGTQRELKVDTVCLAVGLSPLTTLAEVAGCQVSSNSGNGEVIIAHEKRLQTTMPGIFVAGDAGGVEEASIAMEEGFIAGLNALAYLGLANDVSKETAAHEARICAIRKVGVRHPLELDLGAYAGFHGPKVCIECSQEIPCDPCEKSCPTNAISVGADLCATPQAALDKCIGCAKCVAACPGHACFLINWHYAPGKCEIALPYEYLPLPRVGAIVGALDREGNTVCQGVISNIQSAKSFDNTAVVWVTVPQHYAGSVRSIAKEAK